MRLGRHRFACAGMMELADVPDSKSGGSDTVRVRPPLPAPVKALVSASAFRLFDISYIRRWRSWITQQIPILKNGGSNPFRRAKSKTSQNHAFLRCKGRFIVLIFCQKMSENNRKNLNYICIMQTRCRYEIFLVCFFCCKNNTCAFVALQILTLYAEDFFAKRLVCELPPVSLRISVIEFVKIDIGKQR